jgi:hypothetical protein
MELDWGCLARQIYANNPGRSKMEAKQPMRRLMIGQYLANVTIFGISFVPRVSG